VAFSPDGTRLATLGADNLVRLYPLDLRALLKLAKQHVTRELTPDECQTYYVEAPCAPAP
jgi:WD40 repeat protein